MLRIDPVFSEGSIPILLASDDKYARYITVVVESIIQNSSDENNYDIIVLGSKIAEPTKERLYASTRGKSNFSLRVFDFAEELEKTDFKIVSYYSNAIYMRIYMPTVMPNYSKAIYLDCDLIVERDIAELYNIDIGTNLVAAVRDIGMLMHYFTEDKRYISMEYFENELAGVDPENYFNSGVLVMNLEEFRGRFTLEELIEAVNRPGLHFPDQDGLNMLCTGSTHFLNCAWNTLPETLGNRKVNEMVKCIPEKYMSEYIAARSKPSIVHYAMKQKPWNYTSEIDPTLFLRFWKYARTCEYSKEIFFDIKDIELKERLLYLGVGEEDVALVKKKNDVLYTAGGMLLEAATAMRVKLDFFTVSDGEAVIEGSFAVALEKEIDSIPLWVFDGKEKYFAKTYERRVAKRSDDQYLVGFKVALPLDAVSGRTLSFFSRIEGIAIRRLLNFSKHFPVDRITKHQYFATDGYILTCSADSITLTASTKALLKKHERAFSSELKKHKKAGLKAILMRRFAKAAKKRAKKPLWIVRDNFLNCDNGTAFYNYAKGRNEADVYMLVREGDEGIDALKKSGAKLVYEGSKKYKWLSLRADWVISSVISPTLFNPFADRFELYRDILASRKFLFLQHGVISQDLSREHNKFIYNPTGFLVSGNDEYDSLINGNYYYDEKDVWLTGLPRFDYLKNEDEKIVTVMFTWRKALGLPIKATEDSLSRFEKSDYFRFLHDLINSERLCEAARTMGYKIAIRPHPLLNEYSHLFIDDGNDQALILDKLSFCELYAKSSLMVTDYSSAIYDFLYLGKPIFYSQHDKDDFFSGGHAYDKGYLDYETNGYGEVEYTLDGTIDRIIEYMRSDCQMKPLYKERVDSFFKYRDKDNCKRVYEKILEYSKK